MPKARYQDQDMTHRKTRRRREIERAIAAFVSSGGGGLKASPKSGKRRESGRIQFSERKESGAVAGALYLINTDQVFGTHSG